MFCFWVAVTFLNPLCGLQRMALIIARYGELFLKGANQSFFERLLRQNIQLKLPQTKVWKGRGRVFLEAERAERLREVFGLTSYSRCVRTAADLEKIKVAAVELLSGKKGTFKVETTRSDKRFPLTSPEINKEVGRYVEEQTQLRFAFKDPEMVLEIEINQEGAFLFTERAACLGGMPTGVEGSVLLLVEHEASLLAGILMMKRGCYVLPVAFEEKDISLLQRFSPKKFDLKLMKDMAEIEKMAAEKKIAVLVVGQQWDDYTPVETRLTVLRPLVGYGEGRVEEEWGRFTGKNRNLSGQARHLTLNKT